jgi:predicted RND superfamily exporter protein
MEQQVRSGIHGSEAVHGVLKHILRNCFFSAFTTAAALGVFSLSAITPLRHFGIFASIGVLIAFVVTFTLLPAIYTQAKIRPRPVRKRDPMTILFPSLWQFVQRHTRNIFALSLLILVLSIIGIARLQFNTDQETYLKKHHPVRVNNQKVGSWFDGFVPMELVFHIHEGFFSDPAKHLALFEKVERVLEHTPEIKSWQSPVQLFHDVALDNKALFRIEALDSSVLEQHQVLGHFLSKDGKTLRITVKTRWMSDNEILLLMNRVEKGMAEVLRKEQIDFHFTGAMPVFALMGRRLVDSQVQSVVGAFLLILGAFLVLYRNLRWALLSLIPNILPVAGTLGLMGFLNIPVDVVTVLITSVSFGIAIDDTIHFMSNYREQLSSGKPEDAILNTYQKIGKPLITTSFLLICGFIMLMFSSYRPLIFLGTFISLNILLALIYDLILLPAIIHRLKIK